MKDEEAHELLALLTRRERSRSMLNRLYVHDVRVLGPGGEELIEVDNKKTKEITKIVIKVLQNTIDNLDKKIGSIL